jgi:hypothetical protein
MPTLMRTLNAANEDEVWAALAPFQGEMGVFINYLPGESIEKNFQNVFQIVFAVEFKQEDQNAVQNTLDKFKNATKLEYKKASYSNEDIYYQLGATPEEAGRGGRVVTDTERCRRFIRRSSRSTTVVLPPPEGLESTNTRPETGAADLMPRAVPSAAGPRSAAAGWRARYGRNP